MVLDSHLISQITNIKVNTEKAFEKAKGCSRLMMARSMKVDGVIIRCMEEEEKPFKMENALLSTIKMATN